MSAKTVIKLKMPVSEVERFIREMSMQGYDVVTTTEAADIHGYEFELDGWTRDQYAAGINYRTDDAWVGIRPE
jgi:hypothetical protein